MVKVDIIVPVYNAHDYVKKCVETVVENTDLTNHRLILIDDKSPDKNIKVLLKNIKEKYNIENIIILENEENKGFVKTVNIGMKYSKNDVVLLNSDTEVTKGWIDKLIKCAYSQKMVATVTPLSNNATLASVPNELQDNELPKEINLDEYANMIEKISYNSYPELPTAHGFCMYIRREAIEDVGLFDEKTFEKGYGEENDFSYRCLNRGYKHLMCDNTFIYHKGTQSFSKEKEEFILSHLEILKKRYPTCYDNTNNLGLNYPYKYVQKNIRYELKCSNRKNILIFIHDFRKMEEKNLGGTTLHLYDIIEHLKDTYNFHVIYPYKYNPNQMMLASFFDDSQEEIILDNILNYSQLNLLNNSYKNMIDKVVKMLKIDLIHIHHLKYQYLDVYDVAKEYNIPVITTLHDFYSICPTIQLLNSKGKYCNRGNKEACKKCMQDMYGLNNNPIEMWRKVYLEHLKLSDKIIVPSNDTKNIILKEYKDLNIDVITHGVNTQKEEYKEKVDNDVYNIAFIGGINKQKGIDILRYLKNNIKGKNIKVHVFGMTCDEKLNRNGLNYIYHGPYLQKDIVKLLHENNIKLVCLFSIWPETYSYTLTECILANIPVIAYDIGAIGERIKEDDIGYLLNLDSDLEEVLKKVEQIRNNKEEYEKKSKNMEKAFKKLKTIDKMCKEYNEIYNKLIDSKKSVITETNKEIRKEYLYGNRNFIIQNLAYNLNNVSRSLDEKNFIINSIVNSRRWKIANKIKVPQIIKRLFK